MERGGGEDHEIAKEGSGRVCPWSQITFADPNLTDVAGQRPGASRSAVAPGSSAGLGRCGGLGWLAQPTKTTQSAAAAMRVRRITVFHATDPLHHSSRQCSQRAGTQTAAGSQAARAASKRAMSAA